MRRYLIELESYLAQKAGGLGGVVTVKPRKICRGDRRCLWRLNLLLKTLETLGLCVRYKQGVYLMERRRIGEAVALARLITSEGGRRAGRKKR